MQKLIITLKRVEKVKDRKGKTKIFNKVSHLVNNENDINHYLNKYQDNVKTHQLNNL